MKVAKSIDELYEEVKDYDLVITNDAPLATALNAKVDVPRVGPFAQTPKTIAMLLSAEILNSRTYTDIETVTMVSEETGLDFKFVHSEIENIREIRRHTKDVEKYLYSKASWSVYKSYNAIPTMEKAMGIFDPEKSEYFLSKRSIAVIGVELFDDLDKHFIPLNCDFIDIIKDGSFEINTIYEIGNDRQIADNAVNLIEAEKAADYAIVVDTKSPMADAVRSALYRGGISFINHVSVRDLDFVRDYLNFLTLALNYETLRVKDVKEIFSNYNGYFYKGRDNFLLNRQTSDDMHGRCLDLKNKMENIRSHTFGEIAVICNKMAKIQVDIVLKELDLYDKKITTKLVGRLVYAVDNIAELKHSTEIGEDEKTGVLVADANNSVFIDRPIVMYLGMGDEWAPSIIGKKYIDVEYEMEMDALRLQILLQQGQQRFYFVNSSKNGEVAKPCSTFDLIFNENSSEHVEINCFADICSSLVSGRWYEEPKETIGEKGENITDGNMEYKLFSKSSFDEFYKCPRAYMYHSLIDSDTRKTTEFGNLIHDFAEFYICYPDIVREKGMEDMIELVTKRYEGLSSPLLTEIDRLQIVKAMKHIAEYIDKFGIKAPLDRDITNKKDSNVFISAYGLDKKTTLCETDTKSNTHPVYGKFDLMTDAIIHDYKTGKTSNAKEIKNKMCFGNTSETVEFQPLIYLAMGLERFGIKTFKQFYVLDHDTDPEDQYNVENSVYTVKIVEGGIRELLENEEFREYICDTPRLINQKFKPYLKDISDIIVTNGNLDAATWQNDTELCDNVCQHVFKNLSDKNLETTKSFLTKMSDLFKNDMLATDDCVFISKDALDNFLSNVDEAFEDVKTMSVTEFPPNPRIDCSKCRYKALCTREVIQFGETEVDE